MQSEKRTPPAFAKANGIELCHDTFGDIADTVPGARRLVIEGMGHALPISLWPRIVGAIADHAKG